MTVVLRKGRQCARPGGNSFCRRWSRRKMLMADRHNKRKVTRRHSSRGRFLLPKKRFGTRRVLLLLLAHTLDTGGVKMAATPVALRPVAFSFLDNSVVHQSKGKARAASWKSDYPIPHLKHNGWWPYPAIHYRRPIADSIPSKAWHFQWKLCRSFHSNQSDPVAFYSFNCPLIKLETNQINRWLQYEKK